MQCYYIFLRRFLYFLDHAISPKRENERKKTLIDYGTICSFGLIDLRAVSNGSAEAFDIFANNKTVRNKRLSDSELIIVYKDREA